MNVEARYCDSSAALVTSRYRPNCQGSRPDEECDAFPHEVHQGTKHQEIEGVSRSPDATLIEHELAQEVCRPPSLPPSSLPPALLFHPALSTPRILLCLFPL